MESALRESADAVRDVDGTSARYQTNAGNISLLPLTSKTVLWVHFSLTFPNAWSLNRLKTGCNRERNQKSSKALLVKELHKVQTTAIISVAGHDPRDITAIFPLSSRSSS